MIGVIIMRVASDPGFWLVIVGMKNLVKMGSVMVTMLFLDRADAAQRSMKIWLVRASTIHTLVAIVFSIPVDYVP